MGKNIFTNLTLICLLTASLVACDKSTFKIREGGDDSKVTSTNEPTVQPEVVNPVTEENCYDGYCVPVTDEPVTYEPVVEEPVTYDPVVDEPVIYPPVVNPNQCQDSKEIFGNVAYIIQGQNSLELVWNYFESRGPADPEVAYYQVVVMDKRMNAEGTFKSKPFENNGYLVHPGSIDENGDRLDKKITFEYGDDKWYWYQLIALDKNKKVIDNVNAGNQHIRKFDIGMYGEFGHFYKVAGYNCR